MTSPISDDQDDLDRTDRLPVLRVSEAAEEFPEFDPSAFSTEITNPFFPLPAGLVRTMEGVETDPETGESHDFLIEATFKDARSRGRSSGSSYRVAGTFVERDGQPFLSQ